MLWHASAVSPGACVSVTQFDLFGATHIVLIHQPGGDEGARVDDPARKSCRLFCCQCLSAAQCGSWLLDAPRARSVAHRAVGMCSKGAP